jgi:hypothetical protein
LSSTFAANQFSLKFKGASVERDYLDPPRFSIDQKQIQLETGSVAQALRNKPAREILSAYAYDRCGLIAASHAAVVECATIGAAPQPARTYP